MVKVVLSERQIYFTEDQAVALAGVTRRQLGYWRETDVFQPQIEADPEDFLFTFRDLVGLRTLASLRRRVSLQELRKVGRWLRKNYRDPWSSLRFYIVGRRIQFDDPKSGRRLDTLPAGQVVVPIELRQVAKATKGAVLLFLRRSKKDVGQLRKTRGVARSATVVAGTRIPTSAIWSLHERGGVDGILKEYPTLTRADVEAALSYERDRRRARAS
jgi:uncharacterized protein (DUF433 family)